MAETLQRAAPTPAATASAAGPAPRHRVRYGPLWRWLPVSAGQDESTPLEARGFLPPREWTYMGTCPKCDRLLVYVLIDRCGACQEDEPERKEARWAYHVLQTERQALMRALLEGHEHEPLVRLPLAPRFTRAALTPEDDA